MAFRKEKISEHLVQLAGTFLQGETNGTSLITVTGVKMSDDLKRAAILLTVFPEDKEVEALRFVKRKERDFKEYAKTRLRAVRLPYLTFELDGGEKNRQRIDELLQSS